MSRTTLPRSSRISRPLGRAGVAAAAALALAGTAVAGSGSAQASPAPKPEVSAHGLFSPLSLDVAPDGTRYYSQNFMGALYKHTPGTPPKQAYQSPIQGAEVGAVSERAGVVRFAVSSEKSATLMELRPGGKAKRVALLGAFEREKNPDRAVHYGFSDLPAECAAQFPSEGMPPAYTGIVESHPYATAQAAGGVTYVADAAGNSILSVGPKGKVSTVAVLPAVPLTITAEFAEASQWPGCSVGRSYRFEPVPTDVEVGPTGVLYVSTLPGGPEDGSLGAAAAVYKVNPRTRAVTKVVGGLVSATGVAVSPRGDVYVAELFGGRIAVVRRGTTTATTYVQAMMPGDVEWTQRGIYASTKVLTGLSGEPGDAPAGQVVRFR